MPEIELDAAQAYDQVARVLGRHTLDLPMPRKIIRRKSADADQQRARAMEARERHLRRF